jgi:serine/threonine-protein kinase
VSTTVKTLEAGTRLGEWVLEAPLGKGGFAEVWRARHNSLADRLVAVKIPFDRDMAARLRSEGLIQNRVEDPRIVRTLGLDPDHDPPYLVVELVVGESLRDRLRRGRLDVTEALRIAREILLALKAAHAASVIHRDLKPENVLLSSTGEVKVADFGLGALVAASARELVESGSLRTSEGHDIVGTLRYMAPEQREPGQVALDARVDLYAWGIVLYELLTGEVPCGAEMPSQVVPGLDPRLDQVFRRCYARRDGRYASAEAALADVDAVIAAPAAASPTAATRAPSAPAPGRPPRAGVLPRGIALAIDLLPVCWVGLELQGYARFAIPLFFLYDAGAVALTGRTVGKFLAGVAVVDEKGGRPSFPQALARSLARVLSFATLGVGFLLALGSERLTLHDRLAGTSVEHDGR